MREVPHPDTEVRLLVALGAHGVAHDAEAYLACGLVDQYARLIWSITAEFKLAESDAADVGADHLDTATRAHRPASSIPSDRLLAGGDRAQRVPA